MARQSTFRITDKLGYDAREATSLSELLEKTGLNWTAKSCPVQWTPDDGELRQDRNHDLLYRSDTGEYLGIVGNKYQVIQNDQAFAMTEALFGDGFKYVNGGLLDSQVSVTMQAPDSEIEGDTIENFVTITNSFDGSSKLRFAYIPVRKVCANGLCVEIPGVKRVFEIPHLGDVEKNYQKLFIESAVSDGIEAFKQYAAALLKIKVGPAEFTKILDQFFPINNNFEPNKVSTRTENKNLIIRAELAKAMGEEDIANFNGTAYQILQAFCDMETHSTAVYSTKPIVAQRQQFARAFGGFATTVKVMEMLTGSRAVH